MKIIKDIGFKGVYNKNVNNISYEFLSKHLKERRQSSEYNIDGILDRINEVGIDNLTDKEKKFLDEYQSKK